MQKRINRKMSALELPSHNHSASWGLYTTKNKNPSIWILFWVNRLLFCSILRRYFRFEAFPLKTKQALSEMECNRVELSYCGKLQNKENHFFEWMNVSIIAFKLLGEIRRPAQSSSRRAIQAIRLRSHQRQTSLSSKLRRPSRRQSFEEVNL